jgi:Rod binding domain-containing protein
MRVPSLPPLSLGPLEGASAPRRGPSTGQTSAKQAACLLEGLFLRELMRSMRKTVPEGGFGGGFEQGILHEMLDESVATQAAEGSSLGLSAMLERELGGSEGGRGAARPAWATLAAAVGTADRATDAPPRPMLPLPPSRERPLTSAPVRAEAQSNRPVLNGAYFVAPDRPESVVLGANEGFALPVAPGSPSAAAFALASSGRVEASAGEAVVAVRSGTVLAARADFVAVQHADGYVSRYANLGEALAQPGDLVLRGQKLGVVGRSACFGFDLLHQGRALESVQAAALLPLGPATEAKAR